MAASPLILGASGAIGGFLLPRLAEAGIRVQAVSRRPPGTADDHIHWIRHDLDITPVPSDAGVLISAGPLRHALVQVGCCEHLERVIAFSSASVLFKRQSADAVEREMIQSLLETEQALIEACKTRDIALTLFRPCMIYGGGADANIARLKALSQRLPVMPVAGCGLRQPVHADDLAVVTLAALNKGADAAGIYALGGGEVLDYVQMLRRIGARRVVQLPAWPMTMALGLVHRVGFLRDVRAVMLHRQAQDLVVDDSPARAVLGWAPRSFQPY